MNDFNLKKKKVSIIIPSWFEKDQHGKYGEDECFNVATKCLERLLEATPKELYELIIIDNGSTLGCKSCNYFKHADILIRNEKNLGFAPAVNQGVAVARGEFLLFLNNDLYIWENFLEDLLEVFEHEEFDIPAGVAMPNLIKKEYQKDCIDERGKLDFFKAIKLRKEEIVYINKDRYEAGAEFGSAFLMKKELVNKIREKNGGYEFLLETFKMGMSDDRYLWHQVRQFGFQTYRTNRIRCLHVGQLTCSKVLNRKEYSTSNRIYLKKLIELEGNGESLNELERKKLREESQKEYEIENN